MRLKCVYSVISVIDKRLPGNTKKWTIAPFVADQSALSPSLGGLGRTKTPGFLVGSPARRKKRRGAGTRRGQRSTFSFYISSMLWENSSSPSVIEIITRRVRALSCPDLKSDFWEYIRTIIVGLGAFWKEKLAHHNPAVCLDLLLQYVLPCSMWPLLGNVTVPGVVSRFCFFQNCALCECLIVGDSRKLSRGLAFLKLSTRFLGPTLRDA